MMKTRPRFPRARVFQIPGRVFVRPTRRANPQAIMQKRVRIMWGAFIILALVALLWLIAFGLNIAADANDAARRQTRSGSRF